MVQMGNHERNWVNGRREEDSSGHSGHYTWGSLNSTSSGGECGIPTAKRFSMPGNWQDRWATRVPGVWGAVSRRRDCHSAVPPPLPSVGVSIWMGRGCQQNDSLADGYRRSRSGDRDPQR